MAVGGGDDRLHRSESVHAGSHRHQQRDLYRAKDQWICRCGIGDSRGDRTILSHHHSRSFLSGNDRRKPLYPGCFYRHQGGGLRTDPYFCGQAQWILAIAALVAIGVFGVTAVWAVLAGAVIGILYNIFWLGRRSGEKEDEK